MAPPTNTNDGAGAPPAAARGRRGEKPQRELTAANLAQQRHQPFQARMPSGKGGPRDALGREGAVCSLCGMPGHDADVCADRLPVPNLRLSIDVSASQQSLQGEASVASYSDIPDSPSALFPKPSAADIARRLRAEKAAEAEVGLFTPGCRVGYMDRTDCHQLVF
jgi:hypothetical protein